MRAWHSANTAPSDPAGMREKRLSTMFASRACRSCHVGYAFVRVRTAAPKLGWALSEIRFRAENANEAVYANCTPNQTIAFAVSTFGQIIPD